MKRLVCIFVIMAIYMVFYLYGAEKMKNGDEYVNEKKARITSPDMGAYGLKNINEASEYEIKNTPGIDKKTAEEIIEFRDENGDFKSMEDLIDVSGVGEERYRRLRREFCLYGEE